MKEMTKGNPLRLIIFFALPLLMGSLLQQMYSMMDAAIVGKYLGAGALGAVGSTTSVQFLVIGFCNGCCIGFCVPIAQRFGAHDLSTMRRYMFNGIIMTAIIAAAATVCCVVFTPNILHLLSIPDSIWANTRIYITIIFAGIPFTLLYNYSAGILRAVGDSRTPFIYLLIASVTNIVLDIFCIRVLKLGCAGAAAATIISQALSGTLCTITIIHRYEALHLRKEEMKMNATMDKQLLIFGVPMGLQFSITAIGSMVLQSANNSLGDVYISAMAAVGRIKGFAMSPFDAIATATSTFCSQNYGAGENERVRQGFHVGMAIAVFYGIAAGTFLIFCGRNACMLFLPASETLILSTAQKALYVSGYFYWILGILNVCRLSVQGLGYSGRTIFSGVFEMCARCSMAIFMVPVLGYTAVCIADPFAWCLGGIYSFITAVLLLRKIAPPHSAKPHFRPALSGSHGR